MTKQEYSATQNQELRKEVTRLNKSVSILFWVSLTSIGIACILFNFNLQANKEFDKQHKEFHREQMLIEPLNGGDNKPITKPEVDIDEQNMRNKT